MNDEWISVKDASAELGRNKQHVFKILKKLGIESVKSKGPDSHGQKIAYISQQNYQLLQEHLETPAAAEIGEELSPSTHGYFYLIQLEPDHDPGRFKVGFATSVDERLRSHRTAAPLCELVKAWPCKLLWEKTAIDAVTVGCERLYTEVFRTASLQQVETRCQSFFDLMPSLDT
jgi:hypothetical protein